MSPAKKKPAAVMAGRLENVEHLGGPLNCEASLNTRKKQDLKADIDRAKRRADFAEAITRSEFGSDYWDERLNRDRGGAQ
jgi:hypothetical protein